MSLVASFLKMIKERYETAEQFENFIQFVIREQTPPCPRKVSICLIKEPTITLCNICTLTIVLRLKGLNPSDQIEYLIYNKSLFFIQY